MRRWRRTCSAPAAALAAVLLTAAPTHGTPDWRPHVGEAARWAAARDGDVAFAVRTPARSWELRGRRAYPSASLLKPMLAVAYLRRAGVRARALRRDERVLLTRMITRSHDPPANRLIGIVGADGLTRLAHAAGMRAFVPVTGIWGLSRITAADQARFFLRIDSLLPPRHRAYAMALLAGVVPAQRWGIGRVDVDGFRLYFKGGWGSGTGRVEHQVALLTRGAQRLSVAILTRDNAGRADAHATLLGVAKRLLRGLPAAGRLSGAPPAR